MQIKASRQALKVTLIYFFVAGGWILVSGKLLELLVPNPDVRDEIEIFKGCVFVLATGALLYFIVRRLLRGWAREAEQRRQAEEALLRSQERYVLAQRAVNDGLWDWNILNDEDYFSPRWKEIIGYRDDEFPNQRLAFLNQLHPDDLAALKETTRRHLEQGERYAIEFRLRHKDGSYRWLFSRGEGQRDATGRAVRLIGATTDITERKLIEEKLRETATQLLEAQRIANLGSYVLDVATGRWTCSPVMDELLGIADAGFTKDLAGWLEIVHPDDRAELWHYWNEQVLKRKVVFDRIYRIVRRNDRQERTVHGLGKLILDEDGQVVKMLGVIQDITERKLIEEKLRKSEERYQALFERSLDCVFLNDFEGKFLDANQASLDLLGYQREDIATLTFASLLTEDQLPLAFQITEEIRTTGQQKQPAEFRLRGKDGREVHVEIRASLIYHDGKPVAIQGIARDLTERKRADEQINLQFSALTAAANAIVITDRDGKIEWVNPAFTKLTGYSAEEAVGNNPRVLKSGEHPPAFYANLWATISTGNVWHGEMINKRKDGRLYTEEMTITPVRGADGQIAHFVAIKQDVTERHKLEDHLRQAQKMEAIGTLAGGIAHDFNNILGAMFGYGYLLQQDTTGNSVAQDSVGQILKAANRAKELVQQILTFSRQREQKRQVIRLNTVVKEAMKFLRASLPANIHIETDLAADTPAVLADPTQIYQVVMNLATNAHQAMEDRAGQITVTLEPFQPDEQFIQAHSECRPVPYARLTIADTGHGMNAKTLARIFEPFFTTKPVGKGTGLGLAVVHGIVTSHEGIITVASEVGQGTTFRIYFPAQTGQTALTDGATGKVVHGLRQKILLVDDEPALTASLGKLLERLNYQVTTSNAARAAVELFRSTPAQFDLVITDLTMPEMNGLELARQLRAIRPDLPVIMVSGFSPELNQENLRAAGICELLEKPIVLPALTGALHRAVARA
jgi:PAS domain S-box-containing protein